MNKSTLTSILVHLPLVFLTNQPISYPHISHTGPAAQNRQIIIVKPLCDQKTSPSNSGGATNFCTTEKTVVITKT